MGTQKRKRKKVKLIVGLSFCAILITLFIIFSFVVLDIMKDVNGKFATSENVVIEVEKGDTTNIISKKLKDSGVIKYEKVFSFIAKLDGMDTKMQAGYYELKKRDSYNNIFEAMQKIQYRASVRITFPEGNEVQDIIAALVKNGVGNADRYWLIIDSWDFGYDYLPSANTENRLEGYLYPDTYDFFLDDKEENVIKKFLDNFNAKVTAAGILEKAEELSMTFNEAVILGSIIEMEGQLETELSTISSVFHNRLKISMKLQSCATVNYVLPKADRKWILTNADMATDSVYNTYLHKGLPPTPISNPGIQAILAAVSPDETEYLFFCGKGDGSHAFTATYEEHLANTKKYLQ